MSVPRDAVLGVDADQPFRGAMNLSLKTERPHLHFIFSKWSRSVNLETCVIRIFAHIAIKEHKIERIGIMQAKDEILDLIADFIGMRAVFPIAPAEFFCRAVLMNAVAHRLFPARAIDIPIALLAHIRSAFVLDFKIKNFHLGWKIVDHDVFLRAVLFCGNPCRIDDPRAVLLERYDRIPALKIRRPCKRRNEEHEKREDRGDDPSSINSIWAFHVFLPFLENTPLCENRTFPR